MVRVGCFRRHIQDSHPETSNLSQKEREDIASAWTQDGDTEEPEAHSEQGKDTNFTGCKVAKRHFFPQPADITRLK